MSVPSALLCRRASLKFAWLEDRIQPSGFALGLDLTAHLPPSHDLAALVGHQDPGNGHGPSAPDHPGHISLGGPFGNPFQFFRAGPGNGNGNGHGVGGPGLDHHLGRGDHGRSDHGGSDNGGQSDGGPTSTPTPTPPVVSVGQSSSGSSGTSTLESWIGSVVGSITGGVMTPTKHVSAPAAALTQAPASGSPAATPAAHSASASVTSDGSGDSSAQSVSAKQVGGNDGSVQEHSHADATAAATALTKAPTTAASPAEHEAAPSLVAIAVVAQPNAATSGAAATEDGAEQATATGNAIALAAGAGLPGSVSLIGLAPVTVGDPRVIAAAVPEHPETPGMPTVIDSPTTEELVVAAPAPLEPDLADWLLDRLPVDVAAVGAAAQVFLGGLESLGEELVSSESPLTRAAVVFGGLAVFVGWQARRRTRRAGRAAGDELDPFSTRVWARGRWTTGGARA